MKNFIKFLLIALLSFTYLNADSTDVVSNKVNISLEADDGSIITSNDLKGRFTLLWFYDMHCPFCINSMGELKKSINYIENQYDDQFNIIFVSVNPRNFDNLEMFLDSYNLYNEVVSTRIIKKYMINYMNVNSTPTLIILDPYLTIVDKIENQVNSNIYKRHIDYIMKKFNQYNN